MGQTPSSRAERGAGFDPVAGEVFAEARAAACEALGAAPAEPARRIAAAVSAILAVAGRRPRDFALALTPAGLATPAVARLQASACRSLAAILCEARADSIHPPPPAGHEVFLAWGVVWWVRTMLEQGEDPAAHRSEILQILWLGLFDHERLEELAAVSR